MGGFNCTYPAARMHALDQCRRNNPGEECKIYAVRRSVVWQDAEASRARPASQLTARDRLIRACLGGATAAVRIDACSLAIASSELTQQQKRGSYYVRARAFEEIGHVSEAVQDYRAVLRIDPDHAPTKARLEDLIAPAARPEPTRPRRA